MATSLKENGPAEAATSPSHGSINIEKDMDMNGTEHSTAARVHQPDRIDMIDELQRVRELVDCIYLASHGLDTGMERNALARISSDVAYLVAGVQHKLEALDADEDRVLKEMLATQADITAAINLHEGDSDHPSSLRPTATSSSRRRRGRAA